MLDKTDNPKYHRNVRIMQFADYPNNSVIEILWQQNCTDAKVWAKNYNDTENNSNTEEWFKYDMDCAYHEGLRMGAYNKKGTQK